MKLHRHLAAVAAAMLAAAAPAAPYLPANGQQIVETLPRRGDPAQQELRRLRSQLNATPADVTLATTLARRYIALGRSETDPRYLGYAQAALAPWWLLAAPPPEVRLLRATLLQSTHHFDAALSDLEGVLAIQPHNAQAWLTRATVQTVRGDYSGATASCARLSRLSDQLVTITCIANVGAVTGRALRSEQLLELTLQRSAGAPAEQQVWALTLLAEMAARRADAGVAEARFRQALALAPKDSYLLGAWSDFLLDQGRAAEVIDLLQGQTRIDALLLRRALALQQLPGTEQALAADVAELAARFNAAMQRGDTVHQREQARFELHLHRKPRAALDLARQNWAVQKEPADARIYLEAAAQAHDSAAAKPVRDWLAQQLKTGT
jgi:Tfp pilus assembly protein PilF